jgi:hypothetical protein
LFDAMRGRYRQIPSPLSSASGLAEARQSASGENMPVSNCGGMTNYDDIWGKHRMTAPSATKFQGASIKWGFVHAARYFAREFRIVSPGLRIVSPKLHSPELHSSANTLIFQQRL